MSTRLPDYLEPLDGGIYAIDTAFHRPRFDAAYLIVQQGRAAFVDTGPAPALPRLLGALQALGLGPDAVDWVIPTHVHLDHAGGVGTLMAALPTARVLVHPRGARHLIDPSALWAGATAVYGEAEMARSYGELRPVPAERVQTSADGQWLDWAGRRLQVADTPGHARHHHCLWDEATRGWFTGDTFGLSYPELDFDSGRWLLPTTTPVQFEPEALRASIERLAAAQPDCMYLTHYGRVTDVQARARQVLTLLDELVTLARSLQHSPQRHAALLTGQVALFGRSLAAAGCDWSPQTIAEFLAVDLELNAQGLGIWLDRPA